MQTSPASEFDRELSQSPMAKKSPIKTRKPKSRRDRNRPIHEIARLKQQIPVLESEVRALWARADEMQRQELRARAENLQLRSKLKRSVAQVNLLESKLQLYQSQKQTVEASMLPRLGAVGRNLPYDALKDAQILQMLSRSVDENYSKVQQVYQAADLEEVGTEMSETKVLEAKDGSVLQIRSVALSPFDLDTVLEAMWTALEEQTVLKDRECTDIGLELGEARRVIVLKREIVLRGGDNGEEDAAMLSCTIRLVLKKFVESGREIHVWDAFGDWSQAVTTREYGWGIMAPLDVKMDAGNITSVKNCIFMTSSTLSGEEMNGVDQAAQHSVTRLYKLIVEDRRRVIENILLDQARA
ncbi:uncharacterized protein IUM83_01310 [Phytophthora cinnamomi]|uniref:uncharacterized protein n=1 Tax=Phytophthora cinnamomi TaxID=4785 RepID=UPI003559E4D1|nr:hypothetical protein IUM83_01310 [Phytophthora cinnamomi]